MKIGIISDTHGSLPGKVINIFKGVDYIFHAGDIGDIKIIRDLEKLCPVFAIYGNIDTWPIISYYPRMLIKKVSLKTICMVHEIVNVKSMSYQLFKKNITTDILIHGHTHTVSCEEYQNVLYINPGSVSLPRLNKFGSVIILDLGKNPLAPEVVYLKD